MAIEQDDLCAGAVVLEVTRDASDCATCPGGRAESVQLAWPADLLQDREQVVRRHDVCALGIVLEPHLAEFLELLDCDRLVVGADVGEVIQDHADDEREHWRRDLGEGR